MTKARFYNTLNGTVEWRLFRPNHTPSRSNSTIPDIIGKRQLPVTFTSEMFSVDIFYCKCFAICFGVLHYMWISLQLFISRSFWSSVLKNTHPYPFPQRMLGAPHVILQVNIGLPLCHKRYRARNCLLCDFVWVPLSQIHWLRISKYSMKT